MDQKLPLGTRIRMRLHYGICVWCERYLQQITFVKRVSRSFAERSAACSAEAISLQAKQRLELHWLAICKVRCVLPTTIAKCPSVHSRRR
jgi:hypothetical protein